ncbi:MAG: glycosyltransferase family protein [Planctomycetota bacterium]|jgi:spore maturation protein CgeB
MHKRKRIFVIADFKDESPKSIRMQPRMWLKGLVRLGQDVQRFSYRNIMMQASPLASKKFARRFAKQKADLLLAEQVRNYSPDIVLILSMKYLDAGTVHALRDAAPNAVFASRDDDPFPDKNPARVALARQTDIVMTTGGGRFLQTYKDAGVPCCAFIPNMCDPDVQYEYDVDEKWNADIMFTGKVEHTRLDRNDERYALVRRVKEMPNCRIYGAFGIPRVEGMDYFRAISGSKIGLSINIANDVRLYHSDRFINYISCGTFVLARRVPDSDLLFEDGVHVKYFGSTDEFVELARRYLQRDQDRQRIAATGMQKAHADFNCERITGHVLDVIAKGMYDAPWAQVLH